MMFYCTIIIYCRTKLNISAEIGFNIASCKYIYSTQANINMVQFKPKRGKVSHFITVYELAFQMQYPFKLFHQKIFQFYCSL